MHLPLMTLTTLTTSALASQPMRWDISSCQKNPITAEKEERILVTQNFPGKFPNTAECTYTFMARSPGHVIKLHFYDFFLVAGGANCENQKIIIEDETKNAIIGPYCGDQPPPDYTSEGGSIVLKLISDIDSSHPYRGFALSFEEIDKNMLVEAENVFSQFNNAKMPVFSRRGGRVNSVRRPMRNQMGMGSMGRRPSGPPAVATQASKIQILTTPTLAPPTTNLPISAVGNLGSLTNPIITQQQLPKMNINPLYPEANVGIDASEVIIPPSSGIRLQNNALPGKHITSIGTNPGAKTGTSLSTKLYNRIKQQANMHNTMSVHTPPPVQRGRPATPGVALPDIATSSAIAPGSVSSNLGRAYESRTNFDTNQQGPNLPESYLESARVLQSLRNLQSLNPFPILSSPAPETTPPGVLNDPLGMFFTQWTVTKGFIFGVVCLIILFVFVVIIRYKVQKRREKRGKKKKRTFEEHPPTYSSVMNKYFPDKFPKTHTLGGQTTMPRSTVTTDITTLPRYQSKVITDAIINPELEREKSRKAFGKGDSSIREASRNSSDPSDQSSSASSRNTTKAFSITGGTYSGNKAPPPLPDRPQSLKLTKAENKEKLKSLKKQLKLRKKLQKYTDD